MLRLRSAAAGATEKKGDGASKRKCGSDDATAVVLLRSVAFQEWDNRKCGSRSGKRIMEDGRIGDAAREVQPIWVGELIEIPVQKPTKRGYKKTTK